MFLTFRRHLTQYSLFSSRIPLNTSEKNNFLLSLHNVY
jgi:hypothetical protein